MFIQGFEDIRHASVGGISARNENSVIQSRVDALFADFDINLKEKLKKFYERDFVLFGFSFDTKTNKIYDT